MRLDWDARDAADGIGFVAPVGQLRPEHLLVLAGVEVGEPVLAARVAAEAIEFMARLRISDDAAGLARLLELLAGHGDSAEDPVPVAIETRAGCSSHASARPGARSTRSIRWRWPATATATATGAGSCAGAGREAGLQSVERLRELLVAQRWREPPRLTVDVSGVEFMDSDAVRVLVVAAEPMQEQGGELVLARPAPPVASC